MGMTFSQLNASGEEVDRFIIDCVMKRDWFKPEIVNAVSFSFFIKYDDTDQYNSSAEKIIKEFVEVRFRKMQKLGKLKFNKKKSRWEFILNVEFPTLRSDYSCG